MNLNLATRFFRVFTVAITLQTLNFEHLGLPGWSGDRLTHVLDRWCAGDQHETFCSLVGLGKLDNRHYQFAGHTRFCAFGPNLHRTVLHAENNIAGAVPCLILIFRLTPEHGRRIGEASHPGPGDSNTFCLLVTNPTSVYQKADLFASYEAAILMLSETSATTKVQTSEQIQFRKQGFHTVWGSPAPNHLHQVQKETLRGAATGVSIHSQFPLCKSKLGDTSDWYISGRIVHSFVKIAGFTIQLVALYGMPSCLLQAKSNTNALLQQAIDQVRMSDYPYIIAGDFNHHPSTLTSFISLQQAGCQTAESLHHHFTGNLIPPTFKNTTRNDVAIISPQIAKFVTSVSVHDEQWLPGHNPLIVHFTLPGEVPVNTYWPLPHTWLPFQPDPNLIQEHFLTVNQDSFEGDPLHVWSQCVEQAVDKTMQIQHANEPKKFPTKFLPRVCKGRGAPVKLKSVPSTKLLKPAWDGHENPMVDQPSLVIRQMTRQLRRLQSFSSRLGKQHTGETYDEQMRGEWESIKKTSGFDMPFLTWLKKQELVLEHSCNLPSLVLVQQMIHLVKHDLDHKVKLHVQKRQMHAKFLRDLDAKKYGKKMSYSKIRESSPGLMTQVQQVDENPFTLHQQLQHGICTVTIPDVTRIDASKPCRVAGHDATILQVNDSQLELMIHDDILGIPPQGTLTQEHTLFAPTQVANQLQKYWETFRNRDTVESLEDLNEWEEFEKILDKIDPLDPLPFDSKLPLAEWKNAIKATSSNTSRGICGWFADELKMLPDNCISALQDAFLAMYDPGMPAHQMKSRVVPLLKQPETSDASKTRPITVLSMLYRVWSRATSKVILMHWSQVFPAQITGFLPRRLVQLHQYELQFQLEMCHHRKDELQLGGLTVDIVKAFNCLPRLPLKRLLLKLGLHESWVNMWFQSLNRLTRTWQINGTLVETAPTSTGAPEGDSWSVLSMLAINFLLVHIFSDTSIILHLYADNWS